MIQRTTQNNYIKQLERRFRKYIRVIEDPNQHMEEIRIDEKKQESSLDI